MAEHFKCPYDPRGELDCPSIGDCSDIRQVSVDKVAAEELGQSGYHVEFSETVNIVWQSYAKSTERTFNGAAAFACQRLLTARPEIVTSLGETHQQPRG